MKIKLNFIWNFNFQKMGTIPHLSILKGPTRGLQSNLLHNLFEDLSKSEAGKQLALIYKGDYSITRPFRYQFIKNFIILLENGTTHQHTYEEVNQKANQLARIISQSIKLNKLPKNGDGDFIVAVNLPASDELVIILLAIWKAGGAYLPLDQAFPGSRIEHILKEARPAIIIYDQGMY